MSATRQVEPDAVAFPFVNAEPSANWRPGQRTRERKSVSHTIRHGLASMLRSVGRRDDFDVPNLVELRELSDVLDEAIVTAVRNLRSQGHSWQVIGDALGVTRQSAFERYAARVEQ